MFFPNYGLMNNCKEFWVNTGIWTQICAQKDIFTESKNADEFKSAMRNYYRKINKEGSNGAIFMAVLRGKVSEGLDFADMYGRAVLITGIPFAPCKEPKVMLKQKYLNEKNDREGGGGLNGNK